MNLRHAAALTLVGWYLMFPPVDDATRFDPRFKRQELSLKAPLHEWWIADTFLNSDECKAAIASMKLKPGDDWYGKEQCVSSDDARLKGWALKVVPDGDPTGK